MISESIFCVFTREGKNPYIANEKRLRGGLEVSYKICYNNKLPTTYTIHN